jgi:acyl-coenzyme A thioesterase PaaI-like protein
VVNYSGCFICGEDNPAGLRLDFYFDPETKKAYTEFIADRNYEGYRDILHGGIITSVLDEVMVKAILASGILVVTSRLKVEFKQPAEIGRKLRAEGWITGQKGRVFFTEGHLFGGNNEIVATGEGVYVLAEGELAGKLKKSQLK